MSPLGSICLFVTASVLLVRSSGQETGLVLNDSRQVRAVGPPPQGKCVHITLGGTSKVHFYVCCNNCNEQGGNPTCDRTTYQGASSGQYCGHCGADEGNGKWDLNYFRCGGCAGQSQVEDKCNKKYPWVFPGTCWVWSSCFQHRCKKLAQLKARGSLDADEESFCGDGRCGPDETPATCPYDCCPERNPATCGRTNGTCPPACCDQPGCCVTSGSPNMEGGRAAVLAAISLLAYAFRWLFG
uniref:Uncharacterized protein n=1 Tax=Branchiostoma floridae TaxID=7739 RepID=C3XTP7_BRAFL|eukprot:XP_002612664.1 hypothetical protein BRAFLDRAFT_78705 [Branchiostoma floridae]